MGNGFSWARVAWLCALGQAHTIMGLFRGIRLSIRTKVLLLALGAIWGASFLFQRVASEPFGVFALVEMRLALGALVLLPFLWAARAKFRGTLWLKLAVVGALNSAIPFMLFAWGAARAPAAIGAIANSLTVMFAAIVAFVLYGERIGGRRLVGLVAGFAGVVVLVGSKTAGAGAPAGGTVGSAGGTTVGSAAAATGGTTPGSAAGASAGANTIRPLARSTVYTRSPGCTSANVSRSSHST